MWWRRTQFRWPQKRSKLRKLSRSHVAISRDCPKWKIEKDIVTLKYTEKISFADARKRLEPSFDPSKDSYATVTHTPLQSLRPLPPWAKKIRLPIDFKTEIEYLKYILNYCLTRLDTLDEITPENPVPRDASSSDETPPPPQTTPEQPNETTILNTESALQSAASNDDENEIKMLTMSNKITFNEDSSEEDTNNPLPGIKAATSSPATEQSCTRVPKGRGRGDLPKISAFPANAPQPRGRGPVWEISHPHGLPVSQTTQVRDPRVLPKVVVLTAQ